MGTWGQWGEDLSRSLSINNSNPEGSRNFEEHHSINDFAETSQISLLLIFLLPRFVPVHHSQFRFSYHPFSLGYLFQFCRGSECWLDSILD